MQLLSTKNSAFAERIQGFIIYIVLIISGSGFLLFEIHVKNSISSKPAAIITIIALLIISGALIQILLLHFTAYSYLNMYEDHIEGKGVQGLKLKTFSLKLKEINYITISAAIGGTKIYIHSASGIFKVLTDKNIAEKVFDYYKLSLFK